MSLTFNRFVRICSHSVAIADKEEILAAHINGVKRAYRSSLTYPTDAKGVGRKGGRKRKSRSYAPGPDYPPAGASLQNPFSKIWHNNQAFEVVHTKVVPKDKNRCGQCGLKFPIGPLSILPYDIVLSHKERWEYPNPNKDPGQPRYLPSSQFTTRFYCIKTECIMRRFPYLKSDLVKISTALDLQESHKMLLRDQLQVLL